MSGLLFRAATADSIKPYLGKAIDAGAIDSTASDEALREHPLAVWVETRLGISFSEVDRRWVRAKPMTVTEAVAELAAAVRSACRRMPSERCETFFCCLASLSRYVPRIPNASEKTFFAFKLHQFISGAGHCLFDDRAARHNARVTVDGQQFLPGDPDKRLYAVHFCRDCGHEYHPVSASCNTQGGSGLPRPRY